MSTHTPTDTDTQTAAAARRHNANIGEQPDLLDALDPEYIDPAPHCPNCSCGEKRAAPPVTETVTRVGKRVIRKTRCGAFTI